MEAFVAFGSNVEPERCVPEAVRLLAAVVEVLEVSPVYETPPVGTRAGGPFLNGVVRIETALDREALVETCLRPIEARLGRERRADRNAPRTIDLDLVLHGGEIHEDPRHAAHVAVPLADLAPARRHPVTGEPFAGLAAAFAGERAAFRRRPDVEAAIAAGRRRGAP